MKAIKLFYVKIREKIIISTNECSHYIKTRHDRNILLIFSLVLFCSVSNAKMLGQGQGARVSRYSGEWFEETTSNLHK